MFSDYDIGIAGAGPAGCIAAIELQKLGYRVLLVEKNTFPRFHIGFSCSPGLFHWLDTLGLTEQVTPAFLRKHHKASLLWKETESTVKEDYGVSLDRGLFDRSLLEYARQLGVKVIQPFQKLELQENKDRTWNLLLWQEQQYLQFKIRFFVEASGKTSVLKTGKTAYLPPLNATYTFLPASFKHSIIEAGENGWFWATPYKERCLLSYFGNPSNIKLFKTPEEYLHHALKNFRSVHLKIPSSLETFSCNASSYYDKNLVSSNHIKIGDSAYSTDPISSQGVVKAIKTAVHASKVIHTILQHSDNTEVAIDYYTELIQTDVAKNSKWINEFYSQQKNFDSLFWQQYKLSSIKPSIPEHKIHLEADDFLIINPSIIFKNIPTLGTNFIEKKPGIQLSSFDNSFVFIDKILIADLLKEVHDKSVSNVLNYLYLNYSQINTSNLFKHLISNQLLIKKQY